MSGFYSFSKKISLFVALTICFVNTLWATDIKGFVSDQRNGEPLVGAAVILKNTNFDGLVELDGSFIIKNVPKGSFTITCQYLGYAPIEKDFLVENEATLTLNLALTEQTNELTAVVVTGKLDRETDISVRKVE